MKSLKNCEWLPTEMESGALFFIEFDLIMGIILEIVCRNHMAHKCYAPYAKL